MKNLNFLKFKKDFFTPENISKCCSEFWDKHFNLFFLLFSLSILSMGVYFWFQMMYKSDWNADQKKQYQSSQNREVELREQQFSKVIEEFGRRKETYDTFIKPAKDIFAAYPGGDQTTEENTQNEIPQSSTSTPVSNI